MWLYLPPETYSLSAPATADSISASESLIPHLERSVTLKGKSLQPQSWRRAWKTAPRGANFTKSDGHTKPHDLTTAVTQWPTPVSGDHRSSVTGAVANRNARPLCEAIANWPTPAASTPNAYRGAGQDPAKRRAAGHTVDLQDAVSVFPSFPLGLTSSTPGLVSSENTRRLNPQFVESLMGTPLGWTDYAPLETALFRSWLRSHIASLDALTTLQPEALAA